MKRWFLVILLIIPGILSAQVYTVEAVPNQKLITGSYVSNPDRILNETTTSEIDSQLRMLEDSTSVQVAVVVIHSIGEVDIFSFAQDLFNAWGLGQSGKDNGILILFVEDQRTIRFHTGYGVGAILPDVTCKRIQRDFMVPYFKEGDYNTGMIEGVKTVVSIVLRPAFGDELLVQANADEEWNVFMAVFFVVGAIVLLITLIVKSLNKSFANSKNAPSSPYREMKLNRGSWLILNGLIPALIVLFFNFFDPSKSVLNCFITLYFYLVGTRCYRQVRMKKVINRFLQKREYFKIVEFLKKEQTYWIFMGLLFPLPFFFYFFIHLYRKRFYRNHPRQCLLCNHAMQKLDEKSDNAHLSDSQIFEENLKSVDYDVWICGSCQATEQWIYNNSWSKYEKCPQCKTSAFYAKSSRTLVSADYDSSGTGERTKECKFCKHVEVSTYSIPRLTRSSSSSSSSSGSSGGSWGGGSSGGGGASSSW